MTRKAQKPVRVVLRHLVGEEAAKKIVDRTDTPGSDDTGKDYFRAALEELQHPSSVSSTAMETVHVTVLNGFQDEDRDSSARFVSSDHFEQQVLSVKVLQTIIDVMHSKPNVEYRYSHVFYLWVAGILLIISRNRKRNRNLTKKQRGILDNLRSARRNACLHRIVAIFVVARSVRMEEHRD
jgi:hypothetical protein